MCLDRLGLPNYEPLAGLQSNSRGARQRARLKLSRNTFTKDVVSSLTSLARGDIVQEFVPRSATSLECNTEIRRETDKFSKRGEPRVGLA